MRRTLAVVLLFTSLSTFAADQKAARRDLIRQLLRTMDQKALTQTMFDLYFLGSESCGVDFRVRERLFARLDYAAYSEDVYVPVFDGLFTDAELQQLVTFFKTAAGAKVVALFPQLALSMMRNNSPLTSIVEEIEREDSQPWQRTMMDLRRVATAAEAYATDENRYPIAGTYEDLSAVLSPIYIKTLPPSDAWETPFLYVASPDGQHYRFVSAGSDKRFEADSDRIETLPDDFQPRLMDSLERDIIFQDGTFVQLPRVAEKAVQ